MGNSIETIISWRCLTTFLHNRGFDADRKALRLDDVQSVEVKTCFERSTKSLTYFHGPSIHEAESVVHRKYLKFVCSRFSMVTYLRSNRSARS